MKMSMAAALLALLLATPAMAQPTQDGYRGSESGPPAGYPPSEQPSAPPPSAGFGAGARGYERAPARGAFAFAFAPRVNRHHRAGRGSRAR